jgi:MFS family permease
VKLWMLYAFGLAFGLVAGFAIPASNSMVPILIPEDDLQAGNSVSMGTAQLITFIGPTIAGIIIASYAKSPLGSALAFAVDALSFAVSALTLWLIRGARKRIEHDKAESIWASIGAGMRYLWTESNLRFMFTTMALTNFLITGPLLVGIPVLAAQRLPEGAVAFGLLISAYAGGNLAGYLLSGVLPSPTGNALMILLIVLIAAFGGVLIFMGLTSNTWLDFALMLALGIGNGYIGLMLITWIQQRTPKEMLGRMMSILMLSNIGLTPISQAVAGAVSKWTLTGLFLATGGLIVLVDLWMITQPALRTITHSVVTASNGPATPEAESN